MSVASQFANLEIATNTAGIHMGGTASARCIHRHALRSDTINMALDSAIRWTCIGLYVYSSWQCKTFSESGPHHFETCHLHFIDIHI